MKKLLAIVIGFMLLMSCSTTKLNTEEYNLGYTHMMYEMDRTLCQYQVDSMIAVDKLAPLNNWLKSSMTINNVPVTQYLYIKERSNKRELMYMVTRQRTDTIYKCVKRIAE